MEEMKCVLYGDGMAHVVRAPYIPARHFFLTRPLECSTSAVSIGRQTFEEVKYTEI
jgi:hypothetical protein